MWQPLLLAWRVSAKAEAALARRRCSACGWTIFTRVLRAAGAGCLQGADSGCAKGVAQCTKLLWGFVSQSLAAGAPARAQVRLRAQLKLPTRMLGAGAAFPATLSGWQASSKTAVVPRKFLLPHFNFNQPGAALRFHVTPAKAAELLYEFLAGYE